jgi:hypothetical protein
LVQSKVKTEKRPKVYFLCWGLCVSVLAFFIVAWATVNGSSELGQKVIINLISTFSLQNINFLFELLLMAAVNLANYISLEKAWSNWNVIGIYRKTFKIQFSVMSDSWYYYILLVGNCNIHTLDIILLYDIYIIDNY